MKRAGINRVGEVLALPRSELLKIRNFGQKSINELFEVLSNEGLLPSDTSDAAKVSEESEESGEQDSS